MNDKQLSSAQRLARIFSKTSCRRRTKLPNDGDDDDAKKVSSSTEMNPLIVTLKIKSIIRDNPGVFDCRGVGQVRFLNATCGLSDRVEEGPTYSGCLSCVNLIS